MANSKTADQVLADAAKIIKVLNENGKPKLGDLTADTLTTESDKLRTLDAELDEKRLDIAKLVDQVSDQVKVVAEMNVRGRGGVKAVFGGDSPQYEQVGGTRASERKTPKKKTTKGS